MISLHLFLLLIVIANYSRPCHHKVDRLELAAKDGSGGKNEHKTNQGGGGERGGATTECRRVHFTVNGQPQSAEVGREAVLCAGAVATPVIL